jgi:hypothetical protein
MAQVQENKQNVQISQSDKNHQITEHKTREYRRTKINPIVELPAPSTEITLRSTYVIDSKNKSKEDVIAYVIPKSIVKAMEQNLDGYKRYLDRGRKQGKNKVINANRFQNITSKDLEKYRVNLTQ